MNSDTKSAPKKSYGKTLFPSVDHTKGSTPVVIEDISDSDNSRPGSPTNNYSDTSWPPSQSPHGNGGQETNDWEERQSTANGPTINGKYYLSAGGGG